jgi:hypothetical protein
MVPPKMGLGALWIAEAVAIQDCVRYFVPKIHSFERQIWFKIFDQSLDRSFVVEDAVDHLGASVERGSRPAVDEVSRTALRHPACHRPATVVD